MRGGVILIVVALLIGYLGVSGRYRCFTSFVKCLSSGSDCECDKAPAATTPAPAPAPSLNQVVPLIPIPGIPGLIPSQIP